MYNYMVKTAGSSFGDSPRKARRRGVFEDESSRKPAGDLRERCGLEEDEPSGMWEATSGRRYKPERFTTKRTKDTKGVKAGIRLFVL